MLADVAEPRGAQECVHEGMQHHIRIAMARKPAIKWHVNTHQHQWASISRVCETMDIKSRTDPDQMLLTLPDFGVGGLVLRKDLD